MSWRTNRAVVALRDFGRVIGLNRGVMATIGSHDYEARFGAAMLGRLRAGDCVWDVGANIGFYSAQFAAIVGPEGRVVAFEPSPTNFDRLSLAVGSLSNVVLVPVALGDREATAAIAQGQDPTGATSRVIATSANASDRSAEICVCRGDELLRSGKVPIPDAIKIDTEGFELEVVRGLSQTLQRLNVRAVFVEVHFGLLKERGLKGAAAEIEQLLTISGFRCTWADSSHIVALRRDR